MESFYRLRRGGDNVFKSINKQASYSLRNILLCQLSLKKAPQKNLKFS